MNVILNIEINTQLLAHERYEFIDALKQELGKFLLDAKIVNRLKTRTINDELITTIKRPISLKMRVPVERDANNRRKSPTCIVGKYLDKWIEKISGIGLGNSIHKEGPELNFPEKLVDLATLPIEKYYEKHNPEILRWKRVKT